MKRRVRLWTGCGTAFGLFTASAAPALESSTTVIEADPAQDRGRCEFGRARAAYSFGQMGLWVGLVGGSAAGAELSKDEDGRYDAYGSLAGMAVGGLGGWLLGRGIGRWSHPCESVPWSDRTQAEWNRYEAERKAFESCAKGKAGGLTIGMLVGAAVGGGIGYAVAKENRATPIVYGTLLGELIGLFLADYWTPDCRTPMAMRYSGVPLDLPPEVRP